jgi:NADH-quinone oxidoreductase subunit G
MPKLTVDGIEVEVPAGATVLQACEAAGKEIPRFCYHERLSIAGNCRMCLVEVAPGPPKPQASCALPAADGQTIKTMSPLVKKAREGVMEFLLINHPLDCPICDQGGECDLQDQSMAYGKGGSRYDEHKRAVTEKYMGPLIKTVMTRCIHCTRCVRFAEEVAGVEEIGAIFRGENMQITSYLEKAVSSEMSGNVIDLCPVGALTSKPYAFEARPWELKKTESIDVMDAVGSNIRVDARGNAVMRVLPRLNEAINEEWISDKTRFACDGLAKRRLDRPWVRKGGTLVEASWADAFAAIKAGFAGLKGNQIGALAGDLACLESIVATKDLLTALGSSAHECRIDGAAIDPSVRGGYVFNTTIAGIETADVILLVATDPRKEAPIIGTRLRKAARKGKAKLFVIGPKVDLTVPYTHVSPSLAALDELTGRKASPLKDALSAAQRPALILGMGALARADGAAVLAQAKAIADKFGLVKDGWNGFNLLHTAASRVGALDAGFTAGGVDAVVKGAKALLLLGVEALSAAQTKGKFVVYLGSHGDAGAGQADVILPAAAYTEKSATYVNTEGRVQQTQRAVFPPGDAREDWTILRALSDVLGHKLPYDTLAQLRGRMGALAQPGLGSSAWGSFGTKGDISADDVMLPVTNFYTTNPIARASETMAACVAQILTQGDGKATGTHG